jgi:hypothetical protein
MADNLLDYYLGPTGIPDRLRHLNELLNPIVALSEAGQDMRRGDYVGALTNTVAAAVPIAGGRVAMKATRGIPSLAPRSYDEATSAVSETLTGVSAPKPSDMTDMTRRQFMTGVAAAGGAAAMGPELLTKVAPDIVRQAGPWELIVAKAKGILDDPVPSEELDLDLPFEEFMRLRALRKNREDAVSDLGDEVFEAARADPRGFEQTILRETDPDDTLEILGVNERFDTLFRSSGLGFHNLSRGALKLYPEEVADRAGVSVEAIDRYVREMDEDYQDYLAMKGYGRMVDENPELVQRIDGVARGVARDKLLDADVDEFKRFAGDDVNTFNEEFWGPEEAVEFRVPTTEFDSETIELWKALERKRRQRVTDRADYGVFPFEPDPEVMEEFKRRVAEIEPSDINDYFTDY